MAVIIFMIKIQIKKDFFEYGGRSEFFGHSLEEQTNKIKRLKIFKENSIKIRTFFSPNTYDENTFKALKSSGINEVIDGYGLKPYVEDDIKFIPQLFYKPFFYHLDFKPLKFTENYWTEKNLANFQI